MAAVAAVCAIGEADAEVRIAREQTLYVPVYSHVYTGDRALPFNLAATLGIRNTDPASPLTVTRVNYHDSNGRLVKRYLAGPLTLPPQGSTSFYLKERDTSGGFGAHFIVAWESAREINEPIVESVMIGARSGQGISFVSPAREIRPPAGK
jgi:hypothetical protein